MKKWNSRKLAALFGSFALSGYLMSKGIHVEPEVVHGALAENGVKGLVGLGQMWLVNTYLKEQSKIDQVEGEKAVDMLEDVFKGD